MKNFKILLSTLVTTLALHAQPAHNEQILSNSGGDAVAMDKEWAVVGDVANNKAHVYKLDYSKMHNDPMDMWVEQQPLMASSAGTDFGAAVAVSGTHMLVGAPKAGSWQMTVATEKIAQKANAPYFTSITFPEPFRTVPAIFLLTTATGGQPAAIRIKNVTKTGFEAAPVEPKNMNGPHSGMIDVHYLAIEKGLHTFANGKTVIVGDVNTTEFQMSPATGASWKVISLPISFPTTPVVLGQIQTMENDPDLQPKTRPTAPWITTVIDNIQSNRFDIALERSEVNTDSIAKGEIISWMVIEEANGSLTDINSNSINYEIRKISGIKGWDDVGGQTCSNNITFQTAFTAPPLVIASKISRHESDGGWLRRCNIDSNGIGIEIDEDKYADTERGNATGEDISMLAFSTAFTARMTPGSGETYLYEYDAAADTWQLKETMKPDISGEIGFGSAVTLQSDGTDIHIAIGAPDEAYDTVNGKVLTGEAYMYEYDTANDTLTENEIVHGDPYRGHLFAASMDMKGRHLIIGSPEKDGTSSTAIGAAYVYDFNGTAWNYSKRIQRSSASDNEKLAGKVAINSDGNVSMLAAASYSYIYTLNGSNWVESYSKNYQDGGAVDIDDGIYMMAQITDRLSFFERVDGGVRPLNILRSAGSEAYTSVSLYKEQFIVNEPGNSQATVFDVPCGIKPTHLKANEWAMVSLPCKTTADIKALFGDDMDAVNGGSAAYGDSGNWVMYKDGPNYTGKSIDNVGLQDYDPMEQGKGYWIISDKDVTLKVDDNVNAVRTTLTSNVPSSSGIAGYYDFTLPAVTTTDDVKIMAGNPFPRAFKWADVRTDTTTLLGSDVDPVAYVYDVTDPDGTGQPYRAVTTTTPGLNGEIPAYSGFWIKKLNKTGSGITLSLPFEK